MKEKVVGKELFVILSMIFGELFLAVSLGAIIYLFGLDGLLISLASVCAVILVFLINIMIYNYFMGGNYYG